MPTRKIEFVTGGFYHIFNRGAGRQPIFRAAANYEFVLRRMKAYIAELNLAVIAYCLMPNHYHWLLRQDGEAPAGLLAQQVFNSYTKAFNKMYNRRGTLFEGRFQAKCIDNDVYLQHLCRYIHANPVKDGLASSPDKWLYSNYLEWIEARSGTLIDRAFVNGLFPDRDQYRRFVQDYLVSRRLPDELEQYLNSL